MAHSTEQVREKAVQAYLNGESVISIARMLSVSRGTVYLWINKFEKTKSHARKSTPGSGRARLLTGEQVKGIIKIIKRPATDYDFETELWTIPRIKTVAKNKLGLVISNSTLHRRLWDENQSYKKPERCYYEADPKAQKEWIEKIVPEIKKTIKKYNAILYFEDEANVSLVSVVGKTWGPVGQTTLIKTTGNRGGVSAISALSKSGNLVFNLYEKRITSCEVTNFLQQMLDHHPRRHLVVIMDRAQPHVSSTTKKFIESQRRLHVYYLPARSPEFNASEKVWNHLKNNELKSHQAKTIKELKNLTESKLKDMSSDPKLLRGIYWRCKMADLFR